MSTKVKTRKVSRDEARDLYLRIFDEFAVVVKDPTDAKDAEDNSALQVVVDAINARLTHPQPTVAVSGQTIVRDNVNGEYDVWQCFLTYDSIDRGLAESIFDAAWPTTEPEVDAPAADVRNPATTNLCFCGCGERVKSNRSTFAIGHDAKFAGNLIRAARSGEMNPGDAVLMAKGVSPALGRKVKAGIERPVRTTRAGRVATEQVGIVKVGRWDYPARRASKGDAVTRNAKRDGSGEWIPADERTAATFRKV